MKGALDSLGVKPQERRGVILMLMGFFLVGNVIWLVFEIPALIETQSKLGNYLQENKDQQGLKGKLKDKRTEVEGQGGKVKLATGGAQAQKLMELVERQARSSGLNVGTTSGGAVPRRKDQDFEEFTRTIKFTGSLMDLTKFLKIMADPDQESMIRVSDMDLKPTRNKDQLEGSLKFIASYPILETKSKSKSKSKKKGKKK
jgi:hypothetical protein